MNASTWLTCALLSALGAAACGGASGDTSDALGAHAPSRTAAPLVNASTRGGDAEDGRMLAQRFQCARCHGGTPDAVFPTELHCVDCHKQIIDGTFTPAPPESVLSRWKTNVAAFGEVPSLLAMRRFKREWLTSFLLAPHDLRPHLVPSMPRLAMTPAEARDIAAYFAGSGDDADEDAEDARALAGADVARGRSLVDTRGCGTCHAFTGASPALAASPVPVPLTPAELARGITMAPDLRFTRDRLRPAALVRWLENPRVVKHDTAMPVIPMFGKDARDAAAYIASTPLAPLALAPLPPRLPVLDRAITFEEVSTKVFKKTCWHCHSSEDYGIGDGGPGNVGGFGFAPRRLSFVSYETIAAGMLDDSRQRESLWKRDTNGTPSLVRALLARHDEVAGKIDANVRGMPLGMPPIAMEEIQLVETWIAQGHPR